MQLHLKKLSEERVAGWADTLESKRKAKLRWKKEVLEREEAKRQEIDKKEEQLRNKIRQETIQRAKSLQYEEKERVRLLRSQQLYIDVVEKRQQQVKEKHDEFEKIKDEERMWHQRTMDSFQRATEKEKKENMIKKQKAIENAQAMAKQLDEANKLAQMQQQKRMEEEKALIRQIKEDNKNEEKEQMIRKVENRRKGKAEMEKIALDIKTKQETCRVAELADEQKRQKDIDRTTFIALARADLEVKHFEERQAARKLLSDKASKELESRAAREVELFIRDQKAQEQKAIRRQEEETRTALARKTAVHESRKQQIILKQEQSRKEKEADAILAAQCTKQCLKELAHEKKKEAERRKKNLMYRKLQEEQISTAKEKQALEKQKELQEVKKVRLILIYELIF